MFNDLIIDYSLGIVKFFDRLNLKFYFTESQVKHMMATAYAMIGRGYTGKVSEISESTNYTDRTTAGRFINKSTWDEKYLLQQLQRHAIEVIWEVSKETKEPIYVIVDDTISEKTAPSSKAQSPIEGCSFHHSHLSNKTVYGHQFVTVMLRCGDVVAPYEIKLYQKGVDKKADSKIEIARKIISTLPKPPEKGYVMADSWYSSRDLFEGAEARGYHYIGAIKSNRVIYPKGYKREGIQIGAFAKTLKLNQLDLVTVGNERYYMYTYLGRINGCNKVKIIITWPEGAVFNPRAMKAFVSLDIHMSGKQIANHYLNRWPIEVFFRETKRNLGLDGYQIRKKEGIQRYMYLLMLGYSYCGLEVKDGVLNFSDGLKTARKEIKRVETTWIYNQAQKGVSLEAVLKSCKAS